MMVERSLMMEVQVVLIFECFEVEACSMLEVERVVQAILGQV